jgi:regulator of sirC expression with transglutaminase-like and TPR domain
MLNENEIRSMVSLLDDPDNRVSQHIEEQLLQLGPPVIPLLESLWPEMETALQQDKLVQLIKRISSDAILNELKRWKESENQDLLEGVLIINKLQNPNLDRQLIDNQLDKIKLDAWLELNYDLTSFEKIKILNHVFFDVHQFKGDTDNYHNSKNSFISSVLEKKSGNPISLAIIYSIVAQRLNIPVYGVNLPQHFILGYIKDLEWQPLKRFNDESILKDEQGAEIMFYINPFNEGLIFSRENIYKFLKQLKIEPRDDYFKACSNLSIVQRILRNLETSYAKENNEAKLRQVQEMLKLLL